VGNDDSNIKFTTYVRRYLHDDDDDDDNNNIVMTCVGSHFCMQALLAYCLVEHWLYALTNFACESSVAVIGIFLIFLCPLHNLRGPESIMTTSRGD
jgi:hypothetical protein